MKLLVRGVTTVDRKSSVGLSSGEAREKLLLFGPNQIFKSPQISFFGIAKHEITEPMILLLLVVGFFYSIWGSLEDAITIFVIITLLVLAEVYNEFRAKRAIASLERVAAPKTRVLRDGITVEIDSEDVVPGDILILTPGTKVAADARVEGALGLELDESALSGESFPKDKKIGDGIYAGTLVLSGEGIAQVTTTGRETELGKIASATKAIKPPKTALQLAMKSLAGTLVFIALFFSITIPALGILQGQEVKTMILTGLSLSFATIPEELPIIITMVLGLGSYTLTKNKFLVKKLKVAETLGNTTVIVTDKTGTITKGQLKIVSTYPGNREREVLGSALHTISDLSLSPLDLEVRKRATELGIPGASQEVFRRRDFGDGKKTKAVVRKVGDDYELVMSGAPEEVFACCHDVTPTIRDALLEETSKGRRVISIAAKKIPATDRDSDFPTLEKDLECIGLMSFEDSPRPGVRETIARAAKAGIRTVMVTGDHPRTAKYIAEDVGIPSDRVLVDKDLDTLADEQLQEVARVVSVFARATPEHKFRIMRALQKSGEVVAVTGDGINDVLALKGADIGIAMGIKGTDVAKEAAEVVLADDNYVTITQGIFEGRKFFDNLKKGIKYYLSVKVALVLIFLLPVLLRIPMPFAPIQIILLELFMDLAASAGFVAEPGEKSIYTRPPRNPQERLFDGHVVGDILTNGVVLFLAVTSMYLYALSQNFGLRMTQTIAFSAWIFGHIVLAFISRSDREPLLSFGVFTNTIINMWAVGAIAFLILGMYLPMLSDRVNLVSISPIQLVATAASVVVIVGLLEVRKWLGAMKFPRNPISVNER